MPQFIRNLFAKIESEDFSYTNPIKRPECFADNMCHNFPEIQNLLLYLQSEWEAAKTCDESISTYMLNRKDTAGIVIKLEEQSSIDHQHYLIDYLKSQLQANDYIVHANKHISKRVSGNTEESWFYFLKPKPTFVDGKYNQRYGNVTLELKKDYRNRVQFKFQCNYYAGFNYSEPIDFQELLQIM